MLDVFRKARLRECAKVRAKPQYISPKQGSAEGRICLLSALMAGTEAGDEAIQDLLVGRVLHAT